MPHEFDSLFAELGEAKAQVQRSSRKAKALIADRRAALAARAEADEPLFGWSEPPDH